MTLPLSDIRVVDFSEGLAGPLTSMLLADQGAEVIKVERPEVDSATRGATTLGYVAYNRNKRSMVLDTAKPKGRQLLHGLVRWADVFVINMRLEIRQRRGLTYEDLAPSNPRLIYASLTAYGERGPDANQPGYDIATQARVGDIAGRHPLDGPPPPYSYFYHYDMSSALAAAYAIMVALHEKERTGRGQKVETSLLQSALICQTTQMTRARGNNEPPATKPRPDWVPFTYRCSDGRYILVMLLPTGPTWERFCRTMGLGHLARDPRFDTAEKRTQQAKVIGEILARFFSTKPAAEWETLLKAGDNIATVVREVMEVYEDPQVIANEMIVDFDQPGLGPVRSVNAPFKLSGSADMPRVRRPAPRRGEHAVEVLQELGHSLKEIEALKAEGVIG